MTPTRDEIEAALKALKRLAERMTKDWFHHAELMNIYETFRRSRPEQQEAVGDWKPLLGADHVESIACVQEALLDFAAAIAEGKLPENYMTVRVYNAAKAYEALTTAKPAGFAEPLSDEWLGSIGFKYTQEERQPTKHWHLTLGWGAPNSNACMEDLCIELASGALHDGWFCWLRRGTRFQDNFIHVRHIKTQDELSEIITALTGTKFRAENCLYGNFYNDKIAARLRAELSAPPAEDGEA